MSVALKYDRVSKQFGALQALSEISFEVPEGAFFGLLGPNGAGKSTLINVTAGLVHPSTGQAQVMGHDVQSEYRQARRALGVVPQELVYDPFFTVREMLRLQAGYFGCSGRVNQHIDDLIDRLSLSDKADTNLQKLSGGMKRRVLVAQALVHSPQVIVLDEPTAGVDVELRKILWEFVSELHREGRTIVLTTHYLEEAENLCDQIAILNHGKLVAMDDKPSLMARYPYQLLCLTLSNDEYCVPDSLKSKIVEQSGHQLVLRLNRVEDKIGAVLDVLRDADFEIEDLHTKDPDLEDVFIEITGQSADVASRAEDSQ